MTPELAVRIRELLGEGFGVTAIRNGLRSEGFRISNQAVTDFIRSTVLKDIEETQEYDDSFQGSSFNWSPNIKRATLKYNTRYMYYGWADCQRWADGDPQGDIFRRNLQFGDDRKLSQSQIKARMEDILVKGFHNLEVLFMPEDRDSIEEVEFSYYVVVFDREITTIERSL